MKTNVFNPISGKLEEKDQQFLSEIKNMVNAYKHKTFHPETEAHQNFLKKYFFIVEELMERLPMLDFKKELNHFSNSKF